MDWEEIVDNAPVFCLLMVFLFLFGFCFGMLLSLFV